MTQRTGETAEHEERIAEVLGGYMEAAERGEAPAPAVLMQRHPEIAAELAAFFAQQKQFALLVEPLRVAVAAAGQPESTEHGVTGEPTPDPEITSLDLDRTTERDAISHALSLSGSQPAAMDWPTIPGYDILERLGEGGMGVVYQARHRALDRVVALKMIRADRQAKPDHRARFRTEAEAVARIRHPNIIQIYDIGEVAGQPFVALELLDGGRLNDHIASTPQPVRQAAELMRFLVHAVQVAHAAGIVHRDLKPSNVLFASDGTPKITDFGLAKRIDSDSGQTESGQIMGSPSYMAPEQARGQSRNVGPPADIYALGTILYELLTGRAPFKGETTVETLRQVTDDDPVAPSRLVPRLPRDLETICLKCLHKEPARRYQSAQAMGEDLERFLRGEPIKARQIPFWERGAKWVRRRPLAAISWMLSAFFVCGAIVSLFVYQRNLLRRSQTISAHVAQGYDWLHKADAAHSDQELHEMQVGLSAFLPRLEASLDDAQIKQLSDLLHARVREVERLVAASRSDQAERERRQAERERHQAERDQFQTFRNLRNEAFIHDIQVTGLDLPSSLEKTRRAAKAALALYAAPGSGDLWALAPQPASLIPAEREEVTDGCFEIFLVLADAEPDGEQGLRHLVQAARLRRLPTAAYHLRRASCLDRAGRTEEAKQARRDAASLEPVTAFDHFLIGQERFQRGDLSTAIQHFSAALQLRPDHFWAQCLWAVACLQLRHPAEARAGLTACLQQQDDSAWLHLLRGFASYQFAVRHGELLEREPSSAGGVLKTVIEFQLRAAASDYGKALELLEKEPNAELRYALLVNRGLLGLERRDFGNAAADLEAAVQLAPRQLPAYPALALVYQKQDKFEQATMQYSRAIALWPDSAELYRGRADLEVARKDSTAIERQHGLRDLEQAIRLEKPNNRVLARDHTNRARSLLRDRHESEALAACDAAIRVARDFEPAHALRLDLLFKLKRHDDIIGSLDPIIAGGKATAAVYELRALARKEVRDLTGAIEDLTNAMALRRDRSALLRQRGWLYIVSDAPRLASHDFEEAIHLAPTSGDAYAGRGSARLRLGEYREAIADVENALGLGEPTADLCYKAARVYALAAVVAAALVRKMGSETVAQVAGYDDRAAGLLRETLKRTPVDQRASFWRNIQSDPALKSLHRRVSSPEAAAPAVGPGERWEH